MHSDSRLYNETLRVQKKEVLCEDGTYTLFSVEFDESYHSTKDGALHESLQKHIIPALTLTEGRDRVTILDICFGLGYNTLATLYYIKSKKLNIKVDIISVEFDRELIESLKNFSYPKEFEDFKEIIESLSRDFYYEDEQFKIEIHLGDARVVIPQIKEKIDIVYQDPFSPKKNPLLWTRDYFSDIRAISRDDVILTTYSTAIATRMGLYENGFNIFIYSGDGVRKSTVASLKMLELEYVDMELKKSRNQDARSLRDSDFTS